MKLNLPRLNLLRRSILAGVVLLGVMAGQAMAANKPKTVIHVITVKFNDTASKEDVAKAIAGIDTIAGKYKGIKNVWLNPVTVQGNTFTHVLVMEFESMDAFKKYTDSPEQKEWYKIWLPVRAVSNTHDVTN